MKSNFLNNINNPSLHLDFNASLNSPCFIDMSSVSGNSPEEIKFREVYNILQNSPLFRRLFTNMFSETPLINVEFKIDNLPLMQNGQPDGLCKFRYYTNQIQSCNTISIDRNHLSTDPNVKIALTIIHEFVHAFLNVKFKNADIGLSISEEIINSMDFQTCVNTYYNSFSNPEAQHDFFVDFMVPTMVNIFLEIKDQLFTSEQISSVENPEPNAVVYGVTQTIPSEKNYDIILPWSWNNYFTHLSYDGLQNCNAYTSIYPQNSPNLLNLIQYIGLATFLLY